MNVFDLIGDLANSLSKTGEKMTFGEARSKTETARSNRGFAKQVSAAYDHFTKKKDFETADKIATRFTNKDGDHSWLSKYKFKKTK